MKKIEDLFEIQKIELKILESIDYVCRKNGLRYFLAGGTLLGAVRHKGFIPWDNDMDISMPRNDYDRFVEIYNEEVHSKYPFYRVLSMKEGIAYCCPFAKIEDTRTLLYEPHQKFKSDDVGLFADIFPIDGLDPDPQTQIRELQRVRKTCQRIGLSFALFDNLNAIEKVKLHILRILYRKGKRIPQYEKMIDTLRKHDFDKAEYIASTFGLRAEKEIIPQKCFAEHVDISFEGRQFMAPCGYDQYLRQMYGDYMQLPPEEKRVAPHDFDAYWR